jgi:hypothetical protein
MYNFVKNLFVTFRHVKPGAPTGLDNERTNTYVWIIVCESAVTYMATERRFGIIFDRCNVRRIGAYYFRN